MRQTSEKPARTGTGTGDFVIQDGRLLAYQGTETRVTIPEGVTQIAAGAFEGSPNLISLILPSSLQSLRTDLTDLPRLQSLTFPRQLAALPEGICAGCQKLRSVRLPESLRTIPQDAFAGCVSLKEVTLPDNLETIGAGAFSGCAALEEISFPDSLRTIERDCFSETALKAAEFPMGMRTIEDGAFSRSPIRSLTLPESMHDLGDCAFEGCPIPYLTWRGEDLIYGIWLGFRSGHPDAGLYAPDMNLKTAPRDYKLLLCRGFAQRFLQGESFPKEIRTKYLSYLRRQRKTYMLDDCILSLILKENFLPAEELEEWIQQLKDLGRQDLAAMVLDYQGRRFSTDQLDQVRENKMKRELGRIERGTPTLEELRKIWSWTVYPKIGLCITSWKGTGGTRVEVPRVLADSEVAGIMFRAFSPDAHGLRADQKKARAALEEIVLPDTVHLLGDDVFRNCTSLKTIRLPEKLTSLGRSCFEQCLSLREITIPDGITELKEGMFRGCRCLRTVHLPAGLLYLRKCAFMCTGLEDITLPDGVKVLESGCFCLCYELETLTVPATLETVGRDVLRECCEAKVLVTGGELSPDVSRALGKRKG